MRARPQVPPATVARLPAYLRTLDVLAAEGHLLTSSEELATRAGVQSALLRKDLSFLGTYGRRGVGYDVPHLREQIGRVLGVAVPQRLVVVGVGNLGRALAGYAGIAQRGFTLVGLVDVAPDVVGTVVAGLQVRPLEALAELVAVQGATIGVITTPPSAAQHVADLLVAAGVTGILTFAPAVLHVPDDVDVRSVDVASELQILAFHGHGRRRAVDGEGA